MKPIIMGAESVRAILEGRKTQNKMDMKYLGKPVYEEDFE